MKNIKKIVLKTALVLLGSAMATNADAQHIEAKSQTINVGQVMIRQPVTVDYQLHNRGHHTLYIDQVRTSCGCTTVDYPLTSIRGDEFFTVRAVFDAKQMGHFTKQIGIYANGSKTPYILTLKGVVAAKLIVAEVEGVSSVVLLGDSLGSFRLHSIGRDGVDLVCGDSLVHWGVFHARF